MKTGNANNAELGVDTQPFNGAALGTTVLSGEGTLNFGAPVFTAAREQKSFKRWAFLLTQRVGLGNSMNPAVTVKGQDTRADKWKANNIEVPTSSMQLELSPSFVSPEPIYYIAPEYMNGFVNPVFPEPLTNGDSLQFGQASAEPTSPMNGEATATTPTEAPLSPEELKRLILIQFEYYFSRENLVNDQYLVSQMDNDKFVPIATVARFNQIKKLTSDLDLIAEALKDSQHIQLDESGEKVRANVKRCIVILREIPDSTPIQEIEDLFNSPNCPKYINCEFAHNNSWYVTFDTEEDAQKAYRYLREDVRNFRGKPIMARIKAKTLLSRSTLMRPPSTSTAATSQADVSPQPQPQAQAVFSQRPFNTFTVPAPVMTGQQPFPYYPGTIVQTTWLEPRQQFFPPEMIQTSQYQPKNFVTPITITGPRPFFATAKQRVQPKTFFKADNSDRLSDKEERSPNNNTSRRPLTNHRSNGSNNFVQKENSEIYLRRMHQIRNKRDEIVPRFQRLRQERERRQMEQNSPLESDINNLTIDLAPENFPALPSPNSPNEKPLQTASLKDLATNALNQVELLEEKVEKSEEVVVSEISENGQVSSSPPLCKTPPLVQESNQFSRPSYAQMAQKPILKVTSAPKSPTETSNGKEVRKTSNKTEEIQIGQKINKRTNQDEKENHRRDSDASDKSNLSPKPQRQPRDARISSDSSIKSNMKSSSASTRSNSYSGQTGSSVKESYASKSSANINTQQGPVRSPPTKPRTTAQPAVQGQNRNIKNNVKGTGASAQTQKQTDGIVAESLNASAVDDEQTKSEQNNIEQNKVEESKVEQSIVEQNNNKKDQGENQAEEK